MRANLHDFASRVHKVFLEFAKSQLFTPTGQPPGACRLTFTVVGQLRRGGGGHAQRCHTGQVLGNAGRLEICDRAVGEAGPDLTHSQKRYSKIVADGEPLAIRANRHHGEVYLPVARVENVAVGVSQSALHIPDERDAENWRISAVVHEFGVDRIGLVLGPRKNLGDDALINSIALHEQKPNNESASFIRLLPQTRNGGLRQLLRIY